VFIFTRGAGRSVLRRIRHLQQQLDHLDVEAIQHIYVAWKKQKAHPHHLSACTPHSHQYHQDELRMEEELLWKHQQHHEWMQKIQDQLSQIDENDQDAAVLSAVCHGHHGSSAPPPPPVSLNPVSRCCSSSLCLFPCSLSADEHAHLLRCYLIAHTCKDVSIMINLNRDSSSSAFHEAQLSSHIHSWRLPDEEAGMMDDDIAHHSHSRGHYRLWICDLDRKHVHRIPVYAALDAAIVQHFQQYMRDKQKNSHIT